MAQQGVAVRVSFGAIGYGKDWRVEAVEARHGVVRNGMSRTGGAV